MGAIEVGRTDMGAWLLGEEEGKGVLRTKLGGGKDAVWGLGKGMSATDVKREAGWSGKG